MAMVMSITMTMTMTITINDGKEAGPGAGHGTDHEARKEIKDMSNYGMDLHNSYRAGHGCAVTLNTGTGIFEGFYLENE